MKKVSTVLILYGNLVIILEHARSNLCYLICLRHLITSKIPILLHACAAFPELPSNIGTVVTTTQIVQKPICTVSYTVHAVQIFLIQ